MFALCKRIKHTVSWTDIIIIAFIYSVIFGLRYDVGADYLSYFESYRSVSISSYNINYYNYEVGFRSMILFLTSLNIHYAWFFGIVAFLQLFLILGSVRTYHKVYQYLIFTFMIGCVWLSFANGLRQELAFCCFAMALSFVEKKQYYWYYALIVLAISVHKTAILLVLFYPLLRCKLEWLKNKKIQILLLSSAVIIGNIGIIQDYIAYLENYATFLGYGDYFQDRYSDIMFSNVERKGIGYYVLLITNIILIWYSPKYKHFYNSNFIYYIYNLYFVGVLMNYAFEGSQLFQRINYYFYGFNFIVGAFALFYTKQKNIKIYRVLFAMYILTFIATMYRMEENTALFRFYWQVD